MHGRGLVIVMDVFVLKTHCSHHIARSHAGWHIITTYYILSGCSRSRGSKGCCVLRGEGERERTHPSVLSPHWQQ